MAAWFLSAQLSHMLCHPFLACLLMLAWARSKIGRPNVYRNQATASCSVLIRSP